ncbi:alkanesulfonate monooxygenase SsuD/methylene tetrahydromethanopterin reductase-like flavin-dependent oxidoreductase (luciferase family) [Williamsia muralis]|uniref:Alkanesulfonate monooxygenase SsuD/methylene tetrahydromethanopterin reductase-like flavin-dependent oxidoreductase (Luciferase family) n=1 Tax=Williamsia marianensis TaxID=85044 RepID=A0A495K8I6_WILMA|nr:LLM class flavin-dependent oxidoreductase [Williamsia muralis]RKR97481.1 alkanesulfonate monooxygenase SsuD/methylene tetrahydromethanopterin reductase-like flavin-dependent oxidoreductase (luciferase family) [Williamsia muralis]
MTDRRSPALRFGIFMPQLGVSATEMIAAARNAEEAGFDSFWIMDHLYAPGTPQFDTLESWTLLSAIAASTSTIHLGHLVGCNPFRHPSLLAKMAATVDQISGGRLELGLGWGSVEDEFGMFGFDVGSRRDRAEQLGETIEIVRKMFSGESFDYTGKHFRLAGAYGRPTPVRGTIPIHIGGAGKQLTMPLVAEHADWWNCVASARSSFDELAPLRGDAKISVQYPVGVVVDERSRAKVAERTARRMPESGWGAPLIGTPEELAATFESEADRGVELAIVRFHDRADPDTIDRFGRDVISALSEG